VCRALAERGIIAVILGPCGGGRYTPIAHRLDTGPLPHLVSLPALEPLPHQPRYYGPGEHPLAARFPGAFIARLPSLVATVPSEQDAPAAVVSLFAVGLTPAYRDAMQTFAVLLGTTLARAVGEQRRRELSAHLEQRARARADELAIVSELATALSAALTDGDAARLTARMLVRAVPCDVAAVLLCIDSRHTLALVGRAPLTPDLVQTLTHRLTARLVGMAETHTTCAAPASPFVEAALPGVALSGPPRVLADAPIVMGSGRTVGLVAAVDLSEREPGPDHHRLLQAVAVQLAALLTRLSGTRSVEHERLSALIEGITDGVVLLDAAGQVLATNPAGRDLLAALGDTPGTIPAPIRELVAATMAGDTPRTVELTTPGTSRHISATAARVPPGPAGAVVALTLHDVTDAVLMRERLFQSEKMASVGQLVSGVAHELNNPLTGILGFAQLLLARDLDAESRRYVETIAGEAERASKIVQNLLSFARRRRPEKTLVNLNTLVERVLELREYELRVHDIEVHRDYALDLPPCFADPHQIQQVLLNVLINAEQAVKGVRGPRRIVVRTASAAGWVRVTVQDSGPGIAPDHLRRVFDPFFTTKPVGEGTGLGLTISYGIVEEHHGRIHVDSRLGEGATVTIELPAAQEGARVDAAPGGVAPASRGAAARSRILVVDDEQAIRDLLVGLLSLDGHRVEAVRTGMEALQRLAEQPYDAIITDIRMPEMDGIEFYNRILHEHPELARRVIFTTGDTISPDTRAFVEATTAPFLAKPFHLRTVREVVRAVMEGS
jgi:two-component system NtrC family sensor kinase